VLVVVTDCGRGVGVEGYLFNNLVCKRLYKKTPLSLNHGAFKISLWHSDHDATQEPRAGVLSRRGFRDAP